MFSKATLVGALLFAGQVLAGLTPFDGRRVASVRRNDDLAPRQTGPSAALRAYNADAETGCGKAMQSKMGDSGSQTGLAVCYNVPFLNQSNSVFEAEIRLFNLSGSDGAWTGVQQNQLSISLEYASARVSPTTGTVLKRTETTVLSSPAEELDLWRREDLPRPFKTLSYVGMLDTSLASQRITVGQLKRLLTPSIKLSATSPVTGQRVTDDLSSNAPAFLAGELTGESTTATTAVTSRTFGNAPLTASPFIVLPGTTLKTPLFGLGITLFWTVAFVGAVGLGTVGRQQFREEFRRQLKTQGR